jgi:hypothetical protein
MKTCASCGTVVETSARRCPTCGAKNFREDSVNGKNEIEKARETTDEEITSPSEDREPVTIDFSDRRNEILLKIARPDIYRINAFRILEIPVTATPQEVSSHIHKLEIMERLGETNQAEKGFLSLIPPPDADARNEAQQRLGNPESRLIDELFWFWPLEIGNKDIVDDAIAALKRSDFSGAVSVWKHHEENYSEANVSMHNLAIMYHVLALDIEYLQAENLTAKQAQQKQDYWKQAFSRWQILINYEGFWSRLAKRIHELKDPRLTTGTARRLRAGLPLVLLLINASLAIKALERGNSKEATQQINLIKKSGFNRAIMDEALRRAVMPIRDRVKICCTNAENENKNNPENIDQTFSDLIEQTAQPLATLDAILPADHPVRESAHDEVASQIFDITIASTNKTSDWKRALFMLEQALHIAVGSSMHKRIEENIKTARGNDELNTCWFCKTNPSDEKAKIEVKMHGDVKRDGYRVTWSYNTFTVPRCKKCKSSHGNSSKIGCLGMVVGLVLAYLAGVSTKNGWVALVVFALFTAIGFIVPQAVKPRGMKPESYKKEFPAIKEKLSRGWAFGEKPPGVQ